MTQANTPEELHGQILALVAFKSALLRTLSETQRAKLLSALPEAAKIARHAQIEPSCTAATVKAFDTGVAGLLKLI